MVDERGRSGFDKQFQVNKFLVCMFVFVWDVFVLHKVLEQFSPKSSEIITSSALMYPERNRSNKFLPREITFHSL